MCPHMLPATADGAAAKTCKKVGCAARAAPAKRCEPRFGLASRGVASWRRLVQECSYQECSLQECSLQESRFNLAARAARVGFEPATLKTLSTRSATVNKIRSLLSSRSLSRSSAVLAFGHAVKRSQEKGVIGKSVWQERVGQIRFGDGLLELGHIFGHTVTKYGMGRTAL